MVKHPVNLGLFIQCITDIIAVEYAVLNFVILFIVYYLLKKLYLLYAYYSAVVHEIACFAYRSESHFGE